MRDVTHKPVEAGPAPVREKSVRSLLWVSSIHLLRGALFFAVPTLLANITGAAEIGMAEICLAVFAVSTLFIELGTGPAIIRKPDLDQKFLSTVFYVNLTTGLLFCAGLYLAAPLLTQLLKMDPPLIRFLRWLAISFIFFALAIVQRNLLARRLAFRRIAIVNAIAAVIALTVITIGFLQDRSLDALIAGLLCFAFVGTAGLWIASGWRPSMEFEFRELGPLFRFSLSVSAGSALGNLATQWERFLISGLLGPAELGYYTLARNLHQTPLRHLMKVSDTILLPGLSMIQGDKAQCRRYYTTALRFEFLLLGPMVVFIALFASDLAPLLYGPGWSRVVPLVYLTIPVTFRIITAHTVGAVFLSQGRADVQLKWVMLSILLMSTYALIGSPWGIEGVAIAVTLLGFCGWSISHYMANRLIDLSFRDFLKPLLMPVGCSLLLALFMWPVSHLLHLWIPQLIWVRIILGALFLALLYTLILRRLSPSTYSSLRATIREAFGINLSITKQRMKNKSKTNEFQHLTKVSYIRKKLFRSVMVYTSNDLNNLPPLMSNFPMKIVEADMSNEQNIMKWLEIHNDAFDRRWGRKEFERAMPGHRYLKIMNTYFLLEADDPIGCATIATFRHNQGIGVCHYLAIRKNKQHLGLGKYLIQFRYHKMKELGFSVCENETTFSHLDSVLLHFACGATPKYIPDPWNTPDRSLPILRRVANSRVKKLFEEWEKTQEKPADKSLSFEQLVRQTFRLNEATPVSDSDGPGTLSGWDSLGHLDLIAAIETVYGIKLEFEDILMMDSIKNIKSIISIKKGRMP